MGFIYTRILPVPLYEDGALVILVYNIFYHLEALPHKETKRPDNTRHLIIDLYYLQLFGAT